MSRTVSSLDTALRVLQMLVEAGKPVGVTELARALELDKSLIHRTLSTLRASGYIAQDSWSRKYEVGPELIALSGKVLRSGNLSVTLRPVMRELRDAIGETVHLARLLDGGVVYVGREESVHLVSVNAQIGQREPVHCSATGKALLAFLPDENLTAVLSRLTLTAYTPRTITSKEALWEHLMQVRAQGYATDDEEFSEGIRCLAAPVMDYDGQTLAALGTSGPIMRITPARMPSLARQLVQCAAEASARLGYQPKE